MKNNMQKGFTLIELMIVVAIIGILASIAIPQYQNYIAKSQMTRVVGELSALKTAAETLLMEGTVPSGANEAAAKQLGFTSSDLLENGFPAVQFQTSGAGTIIGIVSNSGSTAVKGAKVTVERDDEGNWTCKTEKNTAGTGWKKEFAPKGCPASN